jgi:hypothetical protein
MNKIGPYLKKHLYIFRHFRGNNLHFATKDNCFMIHVITDNSCYISICVPWGYDFFAQINMLFF